MAAIAETFGPCLEARDGITIQKETP